MLSHFKNTLSMIKSIGRFINYDSYDTPDKTDNKWCSADR